jgi:hypothetical protein
MRVVTSSRKAAEKYVKGDPSLLNGMMSAWYTHNLTCAPDIAHNEVWMLLSTHDVNFSW